MPNTSSTGLPDIFYVIGELEVGGTERHLCAVARALKQAGFPVTVYSLAGDGPLRADLETAGVKVVLPPLGKGGTRRSLPMRAGRIGLAGLHLAGFLIRERPTIVHFFLPAAYMIGGIASFIAGVKKRVMSRRSLNLYQRAFLGARWLEGLLHRRMNAILGNSRAVIAELREEGVHDGKLGLIYNGIATPPLKSSGHGAIRRELSLADDVLVLVIVANLIPYKGHLDLIAALGQADTQIGRPWHLLVVGRDDGEGARIRERASQLGIGRKISLLGSRSDVADLLSASDIGLLCSHQEGFSNAVLESMAAGLPLIVTDVGGNAEAVANGETGIVVPAKDPAALANAIVKLAQDSALSGLYGMAARARLEQRFALDMCVEKYAALYRGLVDGKEVRAIPELRDLN